jgi:glucosyl-3-phosphoglycerate synthase
MSAASPDRVGIPEAAERAQGPAESPLVSVVIPAYNEGARIESTLAGVRAAIAELGLQDRCEIIVVDDGSADDTAAAARRAGGARVRQLERNRGKGRALAAGLDASAGGVLLMLDADLGDSAAGCAALLNPVLQGEADMTVASFPAAAGGGGFGLVVRLARWGVRRLTGRQLGAPLSGQRAMTRAVWERIDRIAAGYGAEVGLDVDVLRAGFRLLEIPTQMTHRAGGRDLSGFRHRGGQLAAVARTLLARWLRG